ncbi:MAG: S-layer homology domain-containing protein [Clostridia bacterium]|nr:S-layer homology domain-containing protein [Clostridia bacterium]
MKKIAKIFFIILSVIFCLVYSVNAEEASKSKELILLEYMGIAEEGTTSSDTLVTRAEYLESVFKALKLPVMDMDSEPLFTDMTKAHKYYNTVVNAHSLGIIKGYSGMFRPDDYVTTKEAIIMTVNALAHKSLSEDMIMFVADKLKLYDGVTEIGAVSYRNMSRILFNVLNSYCISYEIADGQLQIAFDSNETYFENLWDIYRFEGMVTAADGIALYGEPQSIDKAVVGSRIFSTGLFGVGDLLGMNVKVFYESNDVENTVVYAYANNSNKAVEHTYHQFESFDGTQIKFAEDFREINYRVNSKTTFLLNGKILRGNEISNAMSTYQRTYKLIDNGGDNTYDFVIMNTPKVYVPETVDKERKNLVDDVYGVLELNKYASYVITDVRGKVVSFDDIQLGRRVLVYSSGDTNCNVKLVVLEEEQDITFTGKNPMNGYNRITSDTGIEYVFSAFSKVNYNDVELLTKYTVYFDDSGEIIDVDIVNRNGIEALYLTYVAYDEMPDTVRIKAMKVDGSFEELHFNHKVSVRKADGTTVNIVNGKEFYTFLTENDKVQRQLVFVKFNSERKITELYQITDIESEPYHLQPYEQYADSNGTKVLQTSRRWMAQTTSFSNQIQLKASTKVFVVPYTTVESVDETLMNVTSVTSFSNDTGYDMYNPAKNTGYKLTPIVTHANELAADYLVIECPEGKTFGKTNHIQGTVVSLINVFDEKTEEVLIELSLMTSDGSISRFNCETKIADRISTGDIIEIKYLSGNVRDRDILLYYDADEGPDGKIYITTSFDNKDADGKPIDGDNLIGWRYYANMRITKGTVEKIDGNYAMLNTMQNKINLTEFVDISTAKIIKFDLKTGKYKQYDKGYLTPGDEFIGVMKLGKMMLFVFYER